MTLSAVIPNVAATTLGARVLTRPARRELRSMRGGTPQGSRTWLTRDFRRKPVLTRQHDHPGGRLCHVTLRPIAESVGWPARCNASAEMATASNLTRLAR